MRDGPVAYASAQPARGLPDLLVVEGDDHVTHATEVRPPRVTGVPASLAAPLDRHLVGAGRAGAVHAEVRAGHAVPCAGRSVHVPAGTYVGVQAQLRASGARVR